MASADFCVFIGFFGVLLLGVLVLGDGCYTENRFLFIDVDSWVVVIRVYANVKAFVFRLRLSGLCCEE